MFQYQKRGSYHFYDIEVFFPDTIKKWKNLNSSVINNPPLSNFKNSIRQIPSKRPL